MPSATSTSTTTSWVLCPPHDNVRSDAHWRAIHPVDERDQVGGLATLAQGIPAPARSKITVIVPLSRCVVITVDLPRLRGNQLRLALAGVLQERVLGHGNRGTHSDSQHFAAGPVESGARIPLAAACDAAWLRTCQDQLKGVDLAAARMVPEAALLPNGACWFGALQAGVTPSWLLRAANGEALRVETPLLEAVLPADAEERARWQWFAADNLENTQECAARNTKQLSAAALARNALTSGWDIQQFTHAAPDFASRVLASVRELMKQRASRFALISLALLIVVNIAGLNLYAAKQQRAADARHAEMENIVVQALPGAPRVLEPAAQLEEAWQRMQASPSAAPASDSSALVAFIARLGVSHNLLGLEANERTLRAAFSSEAELTSALLACEHPTHKVFLAQQGLHCVRERDKLLIETRSKPAAGKGA